MVPGDTLHTPTAFPTRAADGHYYSSFPIALPLLITPFYAPLTLVDVGHMPVERVVLIARLLEKLSASLISALSVMAFLALVRKLTDQKSAWLLTAVYALGSPTWSISSQALWQHGASELAIVLALLFLLRFSGNPDHGFALAISGYLVGLTIAIRLSNAAFCAPIGLGRHPDCENCCRRSAVDTVPRCLDLYDPPEIAH